MKGKKFSAFSTFSEVTGEKKYLGLPQSIRVVSYALQLEKQRGGLRFFPNTRNHLAQTGF